MSVVGLVSATGAIALDRQVYWLSLQPGIEGLLGDSGFLDG